ncbi:MAG: outer membrane lipoprotein-sorting protein [Sphaerochaeta sp.]|jgi:outer membrane lipoprotein-sorting protein|nr:outer membrane lipoprotein-sorting protein [Sphaerochaeta sp.]MDX9914923.1 outer membrane lipoprotein-sorting protein [Sphaerochaeta sp.]
MKRIACITSIILMVASTLFAASLSANQIMTKVIDTQKADTAALDLKLTLIEANGTQRERRIQTLSKTVGDETSSITVFLSPESVRNTRFLSKEVNGQTEQYIYLPALKRVKRIASSEEGGSFMGSDFSYADMASTTYDTDEAIHTLIGEDTTTYTVQSVPNKKTVYGKNVVVVDKSNFLPLKVEFYDLDQKTLLKTLVTEQQDYIGTRPITKVLTMTTMATGHATRLEIVQARYDMPISDNYFTQRFLETGR